MFLVTTPNNDADLLFFYNLQPSENGFCLCYVSLVKGPFARAIFDAIFVALSSATFCRKCKLAAI